MTRRIITVTELYSRAHRALADSTAGAHIKPFDLRMLVAIDDGYARTDDLEAILETEGSVIRRSTGELRAARLVTTLGHDGSKARRGVRSVLTLTPKGDALVAKFRATLAEREAAAA